MQLDPDCQRACLYLYTCMQDVSVFLHRCSLPSQAFLIGSEHNGYTIDYNAEAQFYGVASSNRPELVLPYATVVLDFVANARTESEYFQCPTGLHFPGAIGPFGYYNCK